MMNDRLGKFGLYFNDAPTFENRADAEAWIEQQVGGK